MKSKIIFLSLLVSSIVSNAQQVKNGPELNNTTESTMNHLLDGDNNSFYCYYVKTKGKGTAYYIEKIDKTSLKPAFSKEIGIDKDKYTKVIDVKYAVNNVYFFVRDYSKETKKELLYFQSINAQGAFAGRKEQIAVEQADYAEFVEEEVVLNPGKTKFLIRVSHRQSVDDPITTDFHLLDAKTMKELWVKHLDFSGFTGLTIDDADNIYYSNNDNSGSNKLTISMLSSKSKTVESIDLPFDDNYFFSNLKYTVNANNDLIVGGFIKNFTDKVKKEVVKVGIFSYIVNTSSKSVITKSVKMLDDKMLASMEFHPKQQHLYKYKLDYVISDGNEMYYVGEQYREHGSTPGNINNELNGNTNKSVAGGNMYMRGETVSSTQWVYEYQDVIIAKINRKGEFEWVSHTPLLIHISLNNFAHLFKEYIAVAANNSIYIMNNEHEKNMEVYSRPNFDPDDMKAIKANDVDGTNFVYYSVSEKDGSVEHKLLFKNDDYTFYPNMEDDRNFRPSNDLDLFVPGKNNDIFIYTEHKEKERFSNIILK